MLVFWIVLDFIEDEKEESFQISRKMLVVVSPSKLYLRIEVNHLPVMYVFSTELFVLQEDLSSRFMSKHYLTIIPRMMI